MKSTKKRERSKTYDEILRLDHSIEMNSLVNSNQKNGVKVSHLPKGTQITTTGGTIGVITGKKTDVAIQIKVKSNNTIDEYDWISKEAQVTII